MLQKLFSSKLRVDLLSLFFGRPDEEFYVREIEKLLQEDVGNISRELKNLEGIGLLISRKKGNLKYYLLDRKFPLYDELRSIILKTRGAAGVLHSVPAKHGTESILHSFTGLLPSGRKRRKATSI